MTGKGTTIAILGLLAMLLAGDAFAASVYRCESRDGTRTYSSRRVPGAKCAVVTTYTRSPAAARNAAPASTVTRVSSEPAAPAVGAASPQNVVAGSPAIVSPAITDPGAQSVSSSAVSTPAVSTPAATPSRPQGITRRVQGEVYSYVKDGVRHYTSKPPRGVAGVGAVRTIRYNFLETCYACAPLPGVNFGTLRLNTAAYAAEIRAAAAQHGVDEAIVRAIIHAESSFNPNAMSRVGAQGLMQLMPATARRFGVGNAFDAGQNIQGGVQYLAWLLKRYNGDLTLAAAGYNAGEGAVDKYKGVPPYNETRRYVERVRVLAERYRGILGNRG